MIHLFFSFELNILSFGPHRYYSSAFQNDTILPIKYYKINYSPIDYLSMVNFDEFVSAMMIS